MYPHSSSMNLVNNMVNIQVLSFCTVGKCMVSSFKDYLSCRPTEYSEDDVLLCESRYIDTEKVMKKFKGLKRFSYSSKVVEDEIFYFR